MADRWMLHRAGIINVYQYSEETLHFAGGRLLLRGVNGSGKSTAMNMLLPFLLDADTRRIDAAGEQSSVLRSWMLTGRDDPQPSGYLWIEFARPVSQSTGHESTGRQPQYLVCGCGIRANRSTERVSTWWFVTDRRPGIDLALVENRVPLSVDALRASIGAHRVFAQDQRAGYRNEVRARLFGGADIDQHIRLLHVVRNPRVGDRIDVELPEHLNGALPQLSDAALDDAAQPLEDLEEHRGNVEDLTRTAETLTALGAVYQSYAQGELRRRSDDVLARFEQVRRDRRAETEARAGAAQATAALARAQSAQQAVKATRNRLELEIQALLAQPAYREGQQLDDLRGRVNAMAAAVTRAEAALDRGERRQHEAATAAERAEATVGNDLQHVGEDLGDLAGATATARLPAPPDRPDSPPVAAQLDLEPTRRGVSTVRSAAQQAKAKAGEMHASLDAIDTQAAEVRSAERALLQADRATETAAEAFQQARTAFDQAILRWHQALNAWADEVDQLEKAPEEGQGAVPQLERSLFDVASLHRGGDLVERALDEAVAAHITAHDRHLARLDARHRAETAETVRLQIILEELLQRREPEPPAQWWQRSPRRVTLAELVDFSPELGEGERAGLEAAMEAAGLLGAEVGADASLTLPTGELLAVAGIPVDAPLTALLSVSVPTDGDPERYRGLTPAAVAAVLATVSTHLTARPDATASTAVSVDGSFRIGALQGRHHKAVAEHIGVTARRAALDRTRAEAQRQLETAAAALAATDNALATARAHRQRAELVRGQRPPAREANRAGQRSEVAEARLGDARERRATCSALLAQAEETHTNLAADAYRLAARLALPPDRQGLRQIEAVLGEVAGLCHRLDSRLDNLARSHRHWVTADEFWQRSTFELDAARAELEQRRGEHQPQAMRLATLEDSIGADYAELLASLDLSRHEHTEATNLAEETERTVTNAITAEANTRSRAAALAAELQRVEAACVATLTPLRRALDLPSFLAAAVQPAPVAPAPAPAAATATGESAGDPDSSTERAMAEIRQPVPETAEGARALALAVLNGVALPVRADVNAERVRQSLRQRRDQLGAGWDAEDHQPDESLPLVVEVTGPLIGARIPLPDAAGAVRDQLHQQASLLTAKQDQALRNLLQGLVAREVSDKMQAARELVDLMNKRLATVTTAHGIGASLRWRRRDDLDQELSTTIDLLAKPPDLRTAEEDRALAAALSTRIDRARQNEPEAPYRSLIAAVLDYRAWHTMSVLILRTGDTPKLLSRRTALSEGEKKLVSYLPLFAAVAASCDALAAQEPAAPRFVLLDDAFAKVSEDNHPRLFGLLVQLDLDFIATSERLWGTHATVPELAITEVLRDAELNVIVLEHSRWNGAVLSTPTDIPV